MLKFVSDNDVQSLMKFPYFHIDDSFVTTRSTDDLTNTLGNHAVA